MDKRDMLLLKQFPVVQVPRFSKLEDTSTAGDRLLVAANGLFVQATRAWGNFVRKVCDVPIVMPFGELTERAELAFGQLPKALLREFDAMAIENCTIEIGASIIWNEITSQFRLARSRSIIATGSSLIYEMAPMETGDHLIVDCHSHALHPAYFSKTDNEDDKNAVKFSYVAGSCNQPTISKALRLCVKGIFTTIPLP